MLIWMAGCYGPDEPAAPIGFAFVDSADSGVASTGTGSLDGALVDCEYERVYLVALTTASTGKVFLVDGVDGWSEEHDLAWSRGLLQRTLAAGPYPGTSTEAYVRNVSTSFSCEGHIDAPGVMTYAFWVAGDCIVVGGGAFALLQGDLAWVGGDPSFDLSACRLLL